MADEQTGTGVVDQAAPEKLKKERTPEEREANRLRVEKHRRIKSQDDSSRRPNCSFEINESTAREILIEERGLRNMHVIETCLALANTAAQMNKLHYNRYLFSHGVQKSIEASLTKSATLGDALNIPDEWHAGERIREHELYALFDFGLAWREIDGKKYSFEEFKRLRRLGMTDTMAFGNTVLGMAFEDEPHGRWSRELFIQKNPDLLPENYDMEAFKNAVAAQSPTIRRRLLISSRSSYKSTWNFCDLLTWLFCFAGEMRILILSSTKPLAAGFIKKLRSFLTLKDPRNPTLLNAILPEYMQKPDEGRSSSYNSPMRRLDLIEPSITSASLLSEGLAGMRCDLLIAEDVVEVSNSSTPEQRQKTYELFSMTTELLEPFGYLQIIGTPLSSGSSEEGDEGDIYTRLLKREEEEADPTMKWVICPCWTVKEGVNKLPYDLSLKPEDVDLLFPARLTFKYLMGKARENIRQFRQQSLCSWVPDENELLRVNFDEETIRRFTKPRIFFQNLPFVSSVLALDQSYSISKYADLSCLLYGEVRRLGDKNIFVVCDVVMDRFKMSELGLQVVLMIQRNSPQRVIIERVGAYESLGAEISRNALERYVSIPHIYWKSTTGGGSVTNKFARIKGSLEPLFQEGRLYHVSAHWFDACVLQLVKFDGITKSSSYRKDDYPDCLSIAVAHSGMNAAPEVVVDEKAAEEDRLQAQMRAQHDAMFGNPAAGWTGRASEWAAPTKPPEPAPTRPTDPRARWLPTGLHL